MSLISKTITFADGTSLEILEETMVVPSGSPYIRSYMDLYIPESSMSIGAFEALVNTEEKTCSMVIETINEDEFGSRTSSVEIFNSYIVVAEVGKKNYQVVNPSNGAVHSEQHLFARLEQLTYIEQRLHELGVL